MRQKRTFSICVALIAAGTLLSLPASAQTLKPHRMLWRVTTAIPRAAGRSARNMVTWKDKAAAAEEIGQCAAVALDMMSTIHSQKLDPFAVETSPLLGKHPGPVTLSIAGLAQCLLESAYTQWGHEYLDGDKAYGAQLTGLVLSGVLHGQAINTNEQNASQAAARARLAPGAVK